MNDASESEDSKNEMPKKKKMTVRIKGDPPPFNLQTDNLGILKITQGYLSVGTLNKISPRLNEGISDSELAKSLLLIVATHQATDDEQKDSTLTTDEAEKLTSKDIKTFAKSFLDNGKENNNTDEMINSVEPETVLANKIRNEITQLEDSTKKILAQFGESISEHTRKLFIKNANTINELKALAAGNSSINYATESKEVNFPRITIHDSARINLPDPGSMPINKVLKVLGEQSQKTDSLNATTTTMATLIGGINDAMTSAMLDFEIKQLQDEEVQQRNFKIALYTLVASVMIGIISVGIATYSLYIGKESLRITEASYDFGKKADNLSSSQKENSSKVTTEQTQILKELLITLQQQNNLINEKKFPTTVTPAAQPKKVVNQTSRKKI
jgi:hypothetical protein